MVTSGLPLQTHELGPHPPARLAPPSSRFLSQLPFFLHSFPFPLCSSHLCPGGAKRPPRWKSSSPREGQHLASLCRGGWWREALTAFLCWPGAWPFVTAQRQSLWESSVLGSCCLVPTVKRAPHTHLLSPCEKLWGPGVGDPARKWRGGATRVWALLRQSRRGPCASARPLACSASQSGSVPHTRSPLVPHGLWKPDHHEAIRNTGAFSTA